MSVLGKTFAIATLAVVSCMAHAEGADCNNLRQRLKDLENWQRSPQPGQSQDWLKDEKKKTEWEMQKQQCQTLEKKRFSMGS